MGGGLEQPGQGRTELLEKKLDVMKRKEWKASKHETFHLHFRTSSSYIFYIPHLDAGSDVTEVLKCTLLVRGDENLRQRVCATISTEVEEKVCLTQISLGQRVTK